MSLDQPMLVLVILELLEDALQLLDGIEGCDPEQVLLQRPYEALCAAVAFRGADKRRRGFRAQPGNLVLEDMADVVRTIVTADG